MHENVLLLPFYAQPFALCAFGDLITLLLIAVSFCQVVVRTFFTIRRRTHESCKSKDLFKLNDANMWSEQTNSFVPRISFGKFSRFSTEFIVPSWFIAMWTHELFCTDSSRTKNYINRFISEGSALRYIFYVSLANAWIFSRARAHKNLLKSLFLFSCAIVSRTDSE